MFELIIDVFSTQVFIKRVLFASYFYLKIPFKYDTFIIINYITNSRIMKYVKRGWKITDTIILRIALIGGLAITALFGQSCLISFYQYTPSLTPRPVKHSTKLTMLARLHKVSCLLHEDLTTNKHGKGGGLGSRREM